MEIIVLNEFKTVFATRTTLLQTLRINPDIQIRQRRLDFGLEIDAFIDFYFFAFIFLIQIKTFSTKLTLNLFIR